MRSIIEDLSEQNVIEKSCQKKQNSECWAAYFSKLECSQKLFAYHTAFAADLQHDLQQQNHLHRDWLLPEFCTWKKILTHQYKTEFLTAASREYNALKQWETFCSVQKIAAILKTLFLIWKFIYKFDTDKFLTKFKAWICVHENLQKSTQHDIYAVTLAAYVFHIIIVIVAVFDLKIYQWNAVSVYINCFLNEIVYTDYSEDFEKVRKCLWLFQTLYDLWISLIF